MERYKVTIVSTDIAGTPPSFLVPFAPSALVTAFVDELFKRLARQRLPLSATTHSVTLHLDAAGGPILDVEDVLADIVDNPKNEKIVAVFTKKTNAQGTSTATSSGINAASSVADGDVDMADLLAVRVVTPATAKDPTTAPIVHVSKSAKIRDLHCAIATSLKVAPFAAPEDSGECNCSLAASIARGPSPPSHFFVVHGKSEVHRYELAEPTPACLSAMLQSHLGADVGELKKVKLLGAEHSTHDGTGNDGDNTSPYIRSPVVAICAKSRHVPQGLREQEEEPSESTNLPALRTLDLHTTEMPIHPACMDLTVAAAGLTDLAVDNVLQVFTVHRLHSSNNGSAHRKKAIFRDRSHWQPPVAQTERGRAMFLSTLRMFAAIVNDMDDEHSKDAVMHVLDLILSFPPALRTLQKLFENKTPSQSECAALSHAIYATLDDLMPTDIIGTDHTRLFECSRLFFGFVLEKAKAVKLPPANESPLPYEEAFKTIQLRDYQTGEAVKNPVWTSSGLTEKTLHLALRSGPLADSHIPILPALEDIDLSTTRAALLSGGNSAELLVFLGAVVGNQLYADHGDAAQLFSSVELSDLSHLAICAGKNKLGVYKPSQLMSAPVPCLSFDRKAHVAVYLGQQGCAGPGDALTQFRPVHGEEMINAAVIEQLIAPILQQHESDGSSVLDAIGDARTKRMQEPDELLCFVVDVSASMRQQTDFVDIDDTQPIYVDKPDGEALIDPELYEPANNPFEEVKRLLLRHESFDDMVAIVVQRIDEYEDLSEQELARRMARSVLDVLRSELIQALTLANNRLQAQRQARNNAAMRTLAERCEELKSFAAGVRTHQDALVDFLLYRASAANSTNLSSAWQWSIGDEVPPSLPTQRIPTLPDSVTDIPHDLKDPISGDLILDAVVALDGHTYARASISKWFQLRTSSPMTGLPLDDTTLRPVPHINDAADAWVHGQGIASAPPSNVTSTAHGTKKPRQTSTSSEQPFEITFMTPTGSFQRYATGRLTLRDLYVLAFRGMQGQHSVFQLVLDSAALSLATHASTSASALGLSDGSRVEVRVANDEPSVTDYFGPSVVQHRVLIKVYESNRLRFAYWVPSRTSCTLTSILWKNQLYRVQSNRSLELNDRQVWTDMKSSGDGLRRGHSRESTDQLSLYLQRQHCTGVLDNEDLCSEHDRLPYSMAAGPLVLKVSLNPIWAPHKKTFLTRLDVLKQMFEALINRILAYDYKSHVGLVSVSTKATLPMQMSHVIENFRKTISSTDADGDTALWDGIALAQDQINEYAKKWPEQTKKRIIVISDGVDTKSTDNTSQDLAWSLRQNNIVLDSVSLGDESNEELQAMSSILGGYTFFPTSVANALQICELEPVLSLLERPEVVISPLVPTQRSRFRTYFWNSRGQARLTAVNDDAVPPRREHVGLQDEYILLTPAAVARPAASGTGGSVFRTTRLMNEMRQIVTQARHPKFDIYVSESNIAHWKIVMEGPDDSPYSAGTFLLFLAAGENYPSHAPEVRFVTKMMHPNVNSHGRICHAVLSRDWVADMSMGALLNVIFGLLLQPEASDLVATSATLDYHHDQVEWEEAVRAHVARYAGKSRADWKVEITGDMEG